MEKLHVCVVTEALEGGVARQLELLAGRMPQYGIELSFILSGSRVHSPQVADSLEKKGFAVRTCRMGRSLNPFTDWAAYGSLRYSLQKLQPDLVHTHCFKAGLLGRKAAKDLDIPSVHTPHVFPFEWLLGIGGFVTARLEKIAARWCDGIVALSEYQVEMALRRHIATVDKFEVIPNGVDTLLFTLVEDAQKNISRKQFKIPSDAFVVGTVLRAGRQKNFSGLIDGLETALRQNEKMVILLAGDVPVQAAALQEQQGWSQRLFFCGHQTDMLPFYQALDCFTLCSLWEGLPYTLLEAMSCGLPVVCSMTSGVAALIHDGEDGLVFEHDNSAEMAGLLCGLSKDREKCGYLGSWARAKVEQHYSLDQWAEHIAGYYRQMSGRTIDV